MEEEASSTTASPFMAMFAANRAGKRIHARRYNASVQDFTRGSSSSLSEASFESDVTNHSAPSFRGDFQYKRQPPETLGKPFSPVSDDYEHNGLVNQIKLEPSVWTAAMVAWLLCPLELQTTRWGWCSFIIPPQAALLLCILSQTVFSGYAFGVYDSSEVDCSSDTGSSLLKFLALCVFLSYGMGSEVMEALAMNRWISCFPEWKAEHREVLEEIKNRDGHLWTAFLCCRLATNADGFSALVPVVGLTKSFKWSVRIYCVGFRLIIAIFAMIAAAHLIVHSKDNKEVIENAVVATFILEIDDYYYKFLITDMIKFDMAAIPALGISPGIGMSKADATWQYYGSYILVAALLLAAFSLSNSWGCDGEPMPASLIFIVPLLVCWAFLSWQSTQPWTSPGGSGVDPRVFKPLEYKDWRSIDETASQLEEGRGDERTAPKSRTKGGDTAAEDAASKGGFKSSILPVVSSGAPGAS